MRLFNKLLKNFYPKGRKKLVFTKPITFSLRNLKKNKLTALILCLRFLCHSQVIEIKVKESETQVDIEND